MYDNVSSMYIMISFLRSRLQAKTVLLIQDLGGKDINQFHTFWAQDPVIGLLCSK